MGDERGPRTTGSAEAEECYPAGVNGYETDDYGRPICVNPGFYRHPYNHAPFGLHWGDEPYYGTGTRYVWVLDSLTDQRTREWLHYYLNVNNQFFQNDPAHGVAFLLYNAEDFGIARGTCGVIHTQWIDVCPRYDDTKSRANLNWSSAGGGHFTTVHVRIAVATIGNEYRIQNAIYHEMGHAIGYAHDTNCNSVMTYCSTYGSQYLLYAHDQNQAAAYLYFGHTN